MAREDAYGNPIPVLFGGTTDIDPETKTGRASGTPLNWDGSPLVWAFTRNDTEVPVTIAEYQRGLASGEYTGARDWVENPNPGNFIMDGLSPLLTIGGAALGANALFGGGLGSTGIGSLAGDVPTSVASSTAEYGLGSGLTGGNAASLGAGGSSSVLGNGLQVGLGSGGLGGAPLSASLADAVATGGGTMGGLGFAGSGGAGLYGAGLAGAINGANFPMPPAPQSPGLSTSDLLKYGLPAAGALLGAVGGNQSPAGTTTTTQDVPEWQKPYIQDLLGMARQTFNANQSNPTALNLSNAGAQNLQATINGDFLSPDSNPYLKATYDKAARGVTDTYNYTTIPQLSRAFGNQQAFGTNSAFNELFQKANQGLATGLGDLATGIYGGNYQTERGRQYSGALGASDYANSYAQSPYANLNAYANIVGKPYGSQTQNPYFTNSAGGALSGALGGYALSNLFGK